MSTGYNRMDFLKAKTFEELRPNYLKLFGEKKVSTLYKLRYWREQYHKEFLTKGEIYFSRPSELNDPFDIHRLFRFKTDGIKSKEFFDFLVDSAPRQIGVKPGIEAINAAKIRQQEIIENPQMVVDYFNNLIESPQTDDSIGVFSLSHNIFNEQLWGYYGGGLKGYAIGFDAMKLCEQLFLTSDFVSYTNDIPITKMVSKSFEDKLGSWFEKNTNWSFESEFRFIKAFFPEVQAERKIYYTPEIVKEIILGPRIVKTDKKEIIEIARQRYSHAEIKQIKIDYSKGELYLERLK